MVGVLYLLYRADQRPQWVVAADQLPAALAAVHQCGLRDLEVRTGDGRPPAHADLSTHYLATDEVCGFHVYEALVSLAGVELVRIRYTVPEENTPLLAPHRSGCAAATPCDTAATPCDATARPGDAVPAASGVALAGAAPV